jgi:hypothetical protein
VEGDGAYVAIGFDDSKSAVQALGNKIHTSDCTRGDVEAVEGDFNPSALLLMRTGSRPVRRCQWSSSRLHERTRCSTAPNTHRNSYRS